MPALLPEARDLLTALSYISIDDEVVDAAMSEPDRGLRSLDAIHLATALLWLENNATPLTLLTHDRQLATAARACGLPVYPV